MLLAQGSLWEPLSRLLGMTALKESFCHHENPVNTVASCDTELYPSQNIVIGGEKILKFFYVYIRWCNKLLLIKSSINIHWASIICQAVF